VRHILWLFRLALPGLLMIRPAEPCSRQEPPKVFSGYEFAAWSVAFSPDSKTLASGAGDGLIRLCDVVSGKELPPLKGLTGRPFISFSRDGKYVAAASGELGHEGMMVWEVEGRKERWKGEDGAGAGSILFTSDGKNVIAGGSWYLSIFNAATGEKIKTLEARGKLGKCLTLSPDGKVLAHAQEDQITLWDTETWKLLQGPLKPSTPPREFTFSSDGKLLLAGGEAGAISFWDPTTGKEVKKLKLKLEYGHIHAFSPDGKWLALEVETGLELWDFMAGRKLRSLPGHKDVTIAAAFSPNGEWLASASADHTVRLWKIK
jgi:WD40 repeat protein